MLVSEAKINVEGGHGGPGKVSFFAMKRGPSGGNGGQGGDVYAVLNNNLHDLRKFKERPEYKAEPGGGGSTNRMNGNDAESLLLQMPPGTTIKDLDAGLETELTPENSPLLLCRGGIGGRGNDAFKSATNQTPRKAEPGRPGEEKNLMLILKLIADYGLIGLPNVGKSTILNMLTSANVKTANYPFTTIEPNLGVYNKKVIADIPGLIEGASGGKGLGIKFLKHIEKVKLLIHCVAADSPNPLQDYTTVREELGKYNNLLMEKEEIILLTRSDTVTETIVGNHIKLLSGLNKKVIPFSALEDHSIEAVKKIIV